MEKVGKTTFGSRLPRALFCNFEIGTNFLAGVRAINISKWSDFKLVLRQLEKPEAKAMYDTVVIDTISEAYSTCETFTCAQAGVQKLGDVPYGRAYADCKKEFESALRKITMLGYGICCICHSEVKKIPGEGDTIIETVAPAMPSRAADVVNRLVDIIAYIDVQYNEDGIAERRLITRETPTIKAGSRLPYLAQTIPFSYESLVNAIGDAIDKQQQLDGATVVDSVEKVSIGEDLTFEEIRAEAANLWAKITEDGTNEDAAIRIGKKVEMIFGMPKRLSEITEDQKDLFYLALLDMRDMLS